MASIVLTPFVLYFSLPRCAPAILQFVRDNTVLVDGVGDICSLAAFDFEKHGNSKYGSPISSPKVKIGTPPKPLSKPLRLLSSSHQAKQSSPKSFQSSCGALCSTPAVMHSAQYWPLQALQPLGEGC